MWPIGRFGGKGTCILPPEFLVESGAVRKDLFGRGGLFWQLFGDGQGSCALHTAKSLQRFFTGTTINLAGPNLEYSFGPANAYRKAKVLERKGGFSEVADGAREDSTESSLRLLQRFRRAMKRPGASRK